jgi:GSH-dependent disulfide-bond oxidoreductase
VITLYYAATPNGLKARLFLEEAGLAYRMVPVNLGKGEQLKPEYLAISPNNKIPAIIDDEPVDGGAPITMFESGAIVLYLAEKSGRLIPVDVHARCEVLQWLFWQMAGLGPMAGQIGHFNIYAPEKVPYAIDRYTREVHRLYSVLDRQLIDRAFIANEFSIADIACYPWIVPHEAHGQNLNDFPNLKRWFDTMAMRPATVRTYEGVENVYTLKHGKLSDEERRVLFGQGTQR